MHSLKSWLVLITAFLIPLTALAADRTYVNPRFGTTITYNAAIFTTMDPPVENGDSASWSAPDGGKLLVWGQNNVLDFVPDTLADDVASRFEKVTYRMVGARWIVVSGFAGGKIIYHRAEFGSRGVIHSMELSYPSALSKHYDALASRIADSLIGP
jgi:hypothetical protein